MPDGVVIEPGLRSEMEERWRDAFRAAGSAELDALRAADPELVERDSATLGAALGRVFERLPDAARALVVGHSPTNEAAVLGLTGQTVAPMAKGDGVLITEDEAQFRVQPLNEEPLD